MPPSEVNPGAPPALRLLLSQLFGPTQDFSGHSFAPFRPGVEIARLYGDGIAGPSAALLRYAPGAHVPEHEHIGHEHIVVLEGSQRDERGEYGPGSCLINGPGSRHAVHSEHGCVVL